MTNVLITGGSGFLGSNLAKFLLNKNYKIKVVDNISRGQKKYLSGIIDKIDFVNGDIRDYKFIKKHLNNISVVFHLAAINGTKNFYAKPDEVLDVGINGTYSIINAINESKQVDKLIFASSSEVYQTPKIIPTDENININFPNLKNPRYSYGISKVVGEVLCNMALRKDINYSIFRPHNIYGPAMGNDHVIPELILKILKENQKPKNIINLNIQGSGKETRSFCYIDDAIRQIYLILKKGKNKETYNIGNEEQTSILDLAKKILKNFNKNYLIKKNDLFSGSTKKRCPDIDKIKSLGYFKFTKLDTGIKNTLKYYKKNFNE